jgi:hypothetical protein
VELAAALRDQPEEFARRWRERAGRARFEEHNRLVAEHNDYYPVERKLRFDLRRRDYVDMWDLEWRVHPLDAAWVLEQFPPHLPEALRDQRPSSAPSGGPIVAASGPKRSA